MKSIAPFLVTALLALPTFSQNENQNQYEQRVYVVRAIVAEQQEDRATLVETCESAMAGAGVEGIDVRGPNARVGRATLHRLLNQNKYGRVKEDKSQEKIRGEMLVCQDLDSFLLSGQSNFIPSFYVVGLDGLVFAAEGGGISAAFGQLPGGGQIMAPQTAPVFYPAQGVPLVNTSATIMPSIPYDLALSQGIAEPFAAYGGTMTNNGLADNFDPNGEDDQFETEGYWIIRLLIAQPVSTQN